MDKELKSKWVAALRSGQYKQGRGCLFDATTQSFCCMGVLAHICGASADALRDRSFVEPSLLPPLIGAEEGRIPVSPDQWALASMNDVRRLTFDHIADYIESREEL